MIIPQYIGCDTETGSLYSATGALLAIAARAEWCPDQPFLVHIDPGSQPGKVIEPEAVAKNGYTPERWARAGQVPLKQAMEEFRDWIDRMRKKEGRGRAKIVFHNLTFDCGFLQEAERVTGIELPGRHDLRCSMIKFGELMDIGMIEEGSASLERLGELSGFWAVHGPRREEHEVLEDADACLHGMRWLWERHLAHCVYGVSDGLDAIFHERIRQVTQEGWTAENDDRHINGELRDAAIAYAMVCDDRAGEQAMENVWPWESEWWKPVDDPIRNLAKAGALIAAEIDRLSRRKEGGV